MWERPWVNKTISKVMVRWPACTNNEMARSTRWTVGLLVGQLVGHLKGINKKVNMFAQGLIHQQTVNSISAKNAYFKNVNL